MPSRPRAPSFSPEKLYRSGSPSPLPPPFRGFSLSPGLPFQDILLSFGDFSASGLCSVEIAAMGLSLFSGTEEILRLTWSSLVPLPLAE